MCKPSQRAGSWASKFCWNDNPVADLAFIWHVYHYAGEQFPGAKRNLRGYSRCMRKAVEQIGERAMKIILELPVHIQGHAATACRLALETLLLQSEIIAISQPNTVTQF